jgi:hypothetical protein
MNPRGFTLAVLCPLLLAGASAAAEVRGILSKVDLDRHEIVLEGRGRGARGVTFTFTVDRDTKVMFGDEPGRLDDLAAGKRVRISFEHQGNEDVALLIRALGKPPAHSAAAAAAAPAAPADAITGTLLRVAYTEREIVVVGPGPKGPETETTLAVPDKVPVTHGDRAISFDDLKEGEKVAVTAAKRDGKLTATAIYAGGAVPKGAPKGDKVEKVMRIVGEVLRVIQAMRADRP